MKAHAARIVALVVLLALGAARADAATSTFVSDADTYVSSVDPATNYGSTARLRVDGAPVKRSYLRFDVRGIAGRVTRATLTLVPASDLRSGFRVSSLSDVSWRERSLTYRSAPPAGHLLGSTGPVRSRVRISIDVSSAVKGNGRVGFVLTSRATRALALFSREPASNAGRRAHRLGPYPPRLTVVSSGAPGQAPQAGTEPPDSPQQQLSLTAAGGGSGAPGTGPPENPPPVPGAAVTIAAAGDIACDPANSNFNNGLGKNNACMQQATADLIGGKDFSAVIALGDNQYYCGGLSAFQQSYDLSWGAFKSITHPAVGNHEYLTAGGTSAATGCDASNTGAAGYFNYFGSAAGNAGEGFYSWDVGTWHMVALNSNCSDAGGCNSSSAQGKWLAADLAAHQNDCTLAYWHIPLYSSGGRANKNMQSVWTQLYNAGADVVLTGHDHIYERFAPQDASAGLDTARGLREFIVGTGGANHTSLVTIAANSEIQNASTYGILELTLNPTSYDWRFVPIAGSSFSDAGTGDCH
jgi:acid phosphatase type 7